MKGMKLAALLLLAAPAIARAQATGTITGRVMDNAGTILPGASVRAVNQDTGQTREATVGSDGFYTIPLLSPGLYKVGAELPGFPSGTRDGIRVAVSETARVDLTLRIGFMESIVIEGAPPLVETSNATLGVVIDERKVVDLPLNGRNFTQLGTLIPGVVAPPANLGGQAGDATPGGFGNLTGGFAVNGMRPQSNNFLLDGATNNDSFNTGFVLRPPPDAIQEFKILTHSYNAEYGRNAGSVVNVVTRSGINIWRGSAWEFHRNDALEARNFFAPKDRPKPELNQHQFGASLGGPIVKSKLFVFGYYEGYRNQRGTTVTSVVLTEAQRGGNFAGGGVITDPLTRQPFPGNAIPADRLDPIAVRLLRDFIPAPNTGTNRFTDSPTVEDDRNQLGLRFDYRINDQHTILGRYLRSGRQQTDPTSPSIFSPAGNNQKATLQDYMASDTYMFSSRAINVARIAFNEIDADPTVTSGETNDTFGWAVQNRNPAAVGLPFIGVTGFFNLGDAQQPFAKRINRVVQFTDEFTFLSGRHSWKVGVDVRREQIKIAFINRPNGDFTFNGQYTGSAAADFLLGLPAQFRQGGGDPLMDGTSLQYAAFVQDELRLSPRLTLNLGLRYELARPFYEKDDKLNTFRPGQQSVRFPAAPVGLLYPGDPGIPRGTYEADKNNVAPRVGVAWDPTGSGKTSVRAGWGLFYDLVPGQGDFFQAGTLAPPFQPLTEVNFPTTSGERHFRDPLAGLASGPAGFPPGLIFIGWGSDFTTPYAHHYNLTVQRQIGGNIGVEVGYVGSRGFNMPMFLEVNPTIPLPVPPPGRRGPRIYPAFSLVRPTFSVARSWYDSLQASARMRPTRGLNFLASYTWGHAIDHISGLNIANADQLRPILPVDQDHPSTVDAALAREKGDALFDVRHRFVLSFGWELPRLEGRGGLARNVLGGWQVNGIFQKQTGFPLTAYEPNDIALMALTNRPNQVCDTNADAPHTVEQWFDTTCFQRLTVAANAGQIGDAGRNTVRGPGFVRTDLSLFKNFAIVREHRLQVRVEAFNLFNQARFGQPGGIMGSPLFGVITAAEEGRIVQLGLRYSF
jgi:hypothetical protein